MHYLQSGSSAQKKPARSGCFSGRGSGTALVQHLSVQDPLRMQGSPGKKKKAFPLNAKSCTLCEIRPCRRQRDTRHRNCRILRTLRDRCPVPPLRPPAGRGDARHYQRVDRRDHARLIVAAPRGLPVPARSFPGSEPAPLTGVTHLLAALLFTLPASHRPDHTPLPPEVRSSSHPVPATVQIIAAVPSSGT